MVLGGVAPSLLRGGGRVGGWGGPLENFVGDVTKYVVGKASCRVIVTAPAVRDASGERPTTLAAAGS
jgi:APA family basic amino acid/polyamine antiporter